MPYSIIVQDFLDNKKCQRKDSIWFFSVKMELRHKSNNNLSQHFAYQLYSYLPWWNLPSVHVSHNRGLLALVGLSSNERSIFSALWNRTNPWNVFNEIPRVKWMKSDFLLNKWCQQYLFGTYVSSNWTEVAWRWVRHNVLKIIHFNVSAPSILRSQHPDPYYSWYIIYYQ